MERKRSERGLNATKKSENKRLGCLRGTARRRKICENARQQAILAEYLKMSWVRVKIAHFRFLVLPACT